MPRTNLTLETRFARFVERRTQNECWPWLGTKTYKGYGLFAISGKNFGAHRVSWALANNADVPEALFVCHSCDNPQCVNPAHLWVGTTTDNMRDMTAKGRHRRWTKGANSSEQHCYRGHPYAGQKPYPSERGSRRCRVCHYAAQAARRAAVNSHSSQS